jgi:hypothetical protein
VPFWPPVRTAHFAGFDRLAERLRKDRCIGRRRSHRQARCGLAGTMVDALAELCLGGSHLGQKRNRGAP